MGVLACDAISQHHDFDLVARLGRHDDLSVEIASKKSDIVIDLTRADCVYNNAKAIINSGAHPVIGSSGLVDDEIKTLQDLCEQKKLGGIIAPNFSISAVLMMQFSAMAASLLPEVEIIESHHQQKLDAPSGTAMKTAEMIASARKKPKNKLRLQEIVKGARGGEHKEVTIHSLRLPGVLARQEVIFGSQGETLSITHNSIDRASFMPGIILACQSVQKIDKLYYGLEYLLPFGND
jgi:4-hydroxy-tetrahydrodipicolinate reductase